jgi:hypothetical protein
VQIGDVALMLKEKEAANRDGPCKLYLSFFIFCFGCICCLAFAPIPLSDDP